VAAGTIALNCVFTFLLRLGCRCRLKRWAAYDGGRVECEKCGKILKRLGGLSNHVGSKQCSRDAISGHRVVHATPQLQRMAGGRSGYGHSGGGGRGQEHGGAIFHGLNGGRGNGGRYSAGGARNVATPAPGPTTWGRY
jgi:hypothetical protein